MIDFQFEIGNNHTRCQLNRLHSYWHNYSPFNRAPIRCKTLFIEIKDSFFRFPLQSPFTSMTSILLEYWDRWSVVKKNRRKMTLFTDHAFFQHLVDWLCQICVNFCCDKVRRSSVETLPHRFGNSTLFCQFSVKMPFRNLFLSDPSPIIGNACQWLTDSLTNWLPFSKLD